MPLLYAPVPQALPIQLAALDLWGHSFLDNPLTSQTIGALGTNDANNFGYLYAAAVGIPRANVRNHAVSGSYLTATGYGGVNGVGGNFPKFLVELTDPKTQTLPFTRMGGAHLVCTGSNDIGNNTAANQALLRSTAQDILIYIISRMRASAWYSAQGAVNQAFGANWTNAAVRTTLYIDFLYIGSAISGFPGVLYSNKTTAENYTWTNSIALGEQVPFDVTRTVGPNEVIVISNISSGSASVTLLKSYGKNNL